MEDAGFQDTAPAFNIPSKKSPKRFIYLVIVVIVVILLFVFFSRFAPSSKKETQKPIPKTTVIKKTTPTPTLEITEEPEVDETPAPTVKPAINPVDKATGLNRSKLNIEVQNGSGIEGAAGKVSDFLKNLGYQVSSVGNADNFDYTGITISVNSGSSDYLDLLKSDLSEKYTISQALSDLSASVSADALVVIGK